MSEPDFLRRPNDIRRAVEAAGPRLAPAHAAALRLAADGAGEAEIAHALDVPPESVAPLLEVARSKIARLAAAPGGNAPATK